ncbi:KDP operon transcriptional regulatory protein KdpE [Shimia sp. SK013]|uniref:response regulator n=1 Tax=Shimia sp. SK013 TaxID=1389006 RepID=UPI0006B565F5|nr:response regulator [Shimia sp. SK013]KPA23188.1 KDP operon transcriptional regulatory protein KdpE [Shimia sp. SK013]
MNDPLPLSPLFTPTSQRPLLGIAVLVVEDSRFASDALRMMCVRSGARIRRADSLSAARRHLKTYLPSVVIMDLGLPDGSGTDLIEELAQASPRVDVLLATSGDDFSEDAAMAAGADGFLTKPLTGLAQFQSEILSRLPQERQLKGPRPLPTDVVDPDPVALRDDFLHASDTLSTYPDDKAVVAYVAQFLSSIARSARDEDLLGAVKSVGTAHQTNAQLSQDVASLSDLLKSRLNEPLVI